ncbi:hypothetical protein ACHHYP_15031 [Achlya hypogyna]|uniref:Uncharacterized protein n=1 Tax=Achlya hypogyna TaxID=1202772 RepID=A0A1V9YBQ4_ACHHY|nr:hypothetical protein ACHHYP_15031 [Achlya hypogyna]
MYLAEKQAKKLPRLILEPPPKPPLRQRKASSTRLAFNADDASRLERYLSVLDAKAVGQCLADYHRILSEVEALHSKVAAGRDSLGREHDRQRQLSQQLAALETALPGRHDQRTAAETKLRVLEGAIAATAAEAHKLRASVCTAQEKLRTILAAIQRAHDATAQRDANVAEIERRRAENEACAAEVAAMKQRLEANTRAREASERELSEQCDDERQRLEALRSDAATSATKCQGIAAFVARCTREYAEKELALPPLSPR